MHRVRVFFISIGILSIMGCAFVGATDSPVREIVLHPGMKVFLCDPESGNELLIECKKPSKREITMDGSKRTVKVLERSSRWYGSYGVYTKSRWHMFDSVRLRPHLTYQEGMQHFCSLEEALIWIRQRKSYSAVYYNHKGILISVRHTKEKSLWDIELWQICIAGDVPENIPDAKGDIEFSGGTDFQKCYALNGFQPSEPKVVDGVNFTGRVLDLMNEHDVDCEDVIETIQKGDIKTYSGGRKMYKYGPKTVDGFISAFTCLEVFLDANGHVELLKVGPMWEAEKGGKGRVESAD